MKKIALIGLSMLVLPLVTLAAPLDNVETLAQSIGRIINILIPIVFALALLFFFWGLAMYIFGGAHEAEKAKKTMIWGIVAIFVMAAVWGLVRFLGEALGINQDTAPAVGPLIPR